MREVSEYMARYLFNGRIRTVYCLYEDGTEAEVESLKELQHHARYGIFGVEDQ